MTAFVLRCIGYLPFWIVILVAALATSAYGACSSLSGLTLTSLATVPYDAQCAVFVAYDRHANSAAGSYDNADARITREEHKRMLGERLLFAKFAGFLAAKAAEGTAPNLMYHYTTASESSFANGLWEGSSVTDKLYTDAAQASQELGIPVPNKVIPIQNTGQFIPNAPSTVQRSFRFTGGGSDFINPQAVPPSQLFPAQPIGPH